MESKRWRAAVGSGWPFPPRCGSTAGRRALPGQHDHGVRRRALLDDALEARRELHFEWRLGLSGAAEPEGPAVAACKTARPRVEQSATSRASAGQGRVNVSGTKSDGRGEAGGRAEWVCSGRRTAVGPGGGRPRGHGGCGRRAAFGRRGPDEKVSAKWRPGGIGRLAGEPQGPGRQRSHGELR